MIWHIIRKEILETILSFRFTLSMLFILSLFGAIGFIFVDKYQQESGDYWKETNKNFETLREQSSRLYQLALYEQQIWRKPKPLSLCVEGFENFLPNYFRFNIFSIYLPKVKSRSNFILPHLRDIDWIFVISLVLSFVAMVFTYDRICGERQAGTLRLMLASSIPRHRILLGKYFGVMLTLGIPLLVGLLVNLIIVVSSQDININVNEWLKIVVIIVLSFLYLSIFVLLGMFISSRTGRSANCMVILLLVWVGLVIVLPSFGRIISDAFDKNTTRTELERKLTEANKQIWQNSDKYGRNAGACYANRDHPGNNPPGRARLVNDATNTQNRIYEEHHIQMIGSAITARYFICISPTIIYQRATEAIAGTGINRVEDIYQQVKRYQQGLREYVRNEDQKDPDSLHLLFEEDDVTKNWGAISKKPVDFDTVPKFQERDLGLGESLQLAIWDIGLLALFNLVFFAAVFVSFLKYDVR